MPGCEDCEGELQYFIFMEMVRPLRPLAHTPALGAGTLGAHGAPWRGSRSIVCKSSHLLLVSWQKNYIHFGDAFGIKMNNEHLVTFLFGQIIIITNNYSVNASYKIFDLVKNIYTVG